MRDSAQADPHDPSSRAFVAAVERFERLLGTLASRRPAADLQRELRSLREALVAELETWLRSAHPLAGSWFAAPAQPPAGQSPSVNPTNPCAATGGNVFAADLSTLQGLLCRWMQLQAELAAHWNTIAQVASSRFMEHLAAWTPGEPLTERRKLYDLWIECAEAAYAQTVHTDDFCRVIAELINTVTALRLQGQHHAQMWARAVDLPTRSDIEALKRQVEELKTRKPRATSRKRPAQPRRKRKRSA
jgi:Poly(R)-hydroxyalkanoic acid synthase subunit (PHA_synth_III_E)